MKITITINTDNEAFACCDTGPEVSRILRDLAQIWDYNWGETPTINLRDLNGNTVGKVEVTND